MPVKIQKPESLIFMDIKFVTANYYFLDMKNYFTLFLSALLLSVTNIVASGHPDHHIDPLRKTFIVKSNQFPENDYQRSLMQQPSWKKFVEENESWKVIFNENSGMAHRAIGAPVSVPGTAARTTAENFI